MFEYFQHHAGFSLIVIFLIVLFGPGAIRKIGEFIRNRF